ncbi:MAG: hypothetical protein QF619_04070 [Candidatus Binatia bacterium]|mgnify:CR=1 FL=1|nr:hypothetical protein [Candidatus Binatia bacterium]
MKTRYDKFPFNTAPVKDESGETLYMASRATVDYRVVEHTPPDEIDRLIPESGELREIIIEDALPKFPETKPNLIVLGLVGPFDSTIKTREDLTAAVFGDTFHHFRAGKHIPSRYQNGISTIPYTAKRLRP